MPDLIHSLQHHDIGHLRVIAELWGIELTCTEAQEALAELVTALLDPYLVEEMALSLPDETRRALDALLDEGGRISWVAFVRRFGELREMGPGRRDRDQPHLNPISVTESLFYRTFIARAFFDTETGPQEFAYIPEDLLPFLQTEPEAPPTSGAVKQEPLGHPASPAERSHMLFANDHIIDDATTLLAALRLGWDGVPRPQSLSVPERVLFDLLSAARLIKKGTPQPEEVKEFLEAPRGKALAMLVKGWLESKEFNDLRLIPGLVFEGEWENNPLATRRFILDLLTAIPANQWWSLPAFVRGIKERHPDFQRPAGNYDSWFIRHQSDGRYLRGFSCWNEVDGALVWFLITAPLHWLGIIDLAAPKAGAAPTAFRFTSFATRLLQGKAPVIPYEEAQLNIDSRGRISVPRLFGRGVRYQIARFCEWDSEIHGEYRYQLAPDALKRAKEQGLNTDQLLALLQKHSATPLPPTFSEAIKRWETKGTEARVEELVVLKLRDPKTLEKLLKSKAGRFLDEALGPTTVAIKAGAVAKVLAALVEMGILTENKVKRIL